MSADDACAGFLQWALPSLGLRWRGFRRVRRQVCRRIVARVRELRLPGWQAYRDYLAAHPAEWRVLDGLCRVTISRFHRDRHMWSQLVGEVLPELAERAGRQARPAAAWSAGCGAGEEPYTLAIAWRVAIAPEPPVALEVVATDIDRGQLARAAAARYPVGALRELPPDWRAAAFDEQDGVACLREPFRLGVHFAHHDVRNPPPPGPFDLVLCRNQAFTYLDEPAQHAVLAMFRSVLSRGGLLVVGMHEALPPGAAGWQPRGRCFHVAS